MKIGAGVMSSDNSCDDHVHDETQETVLSSIQDHVLRRVDDTVYRHIYSPVFSDVGASVVWRGMHNLVFKRTQGGNWGGG